MKANMDVIFDRKKRYKESATTHSNASLGNPHTPKNPVAIFSMIEYIYIYIYIYEYTYYLNAIYVKQ